MDGNELTSAYEQRRSTYDSLCKYIESFISQLLDQEGIKVHALYGRCKTFDSFAAKVRKKGEYSELSQITDLAGIRIITHYASDVEKVAELIEAELEVDKVNSVDKGKQLSPDQFGYRSLHYVASLNEARSALREYKSFVGLKFEVQIRSILQHAWAEIEHGLGYKNEIELPEQFQRRFSRLAGLLELADEEFIGIREGLEEYRSQVQAEIGAGTSVVPLNKDTFIAFTETNEYCCSLDLKISEMLETRLVSWRYEPELERFEYFSITNLEQLENKLREHESLIIKRAELLHDYKGFDLEIAKGTATTFLAQVMACQLNNQDLVEYSSFVKSPEGFVEFIQSIRRRLNIE